MHQWGRGLQTRDLDLIAKPLHKDFRYVAYPRSLGKPEQTKEEYLGHYAGIISLWAADLEVSYIGYSSDSLAATKYILQSTFHSITDAPGTVIVHVRIQNTRVRIYLGDVVPIILQMTNKTKTSIGVEMSRESIFIGHVVTDEDGSLKLKQVEEFTDSKTYLDFTQAIAEARAKKQ